jgi:hypothetical protein
MYRRQALTAAVGVAAGLAGCSGAGSRDGGLNLTVFNQADTPYTIEIAFFGDGDSEGEARAYDTSLDLEPGGRRTREAVVEPRRYLVRYQAFEENSRLTAEDHVHFIPHGTGTESLTFDIQESGEVTRR